MSATLSVKQLRARLVELGVTDFSRYLEKQDFVEELQRREALAGNGAAATRGERDGTADVDMTDAAAQRKDDNSSGTSRGSKRRFSGDGLSTSSRGEQSHPQAEAGGDDAGAVRESRSRQRPRERLPEDPLREDVSQLLHFYQSTEDADYLKSLKEELLRRQWSAYEKRVDAPQTCPICLEEIRNTNDAFPPLIQEQPGDVSDTDKPVVAAYHNRCLAQHILVKAGEASFPVKWPMPAAASSVDTSSSSSTQPNGGPAMYYAIHPLTIRQALTSKEYVDRYLLAYDKFEELQELRERRANESSTGASPSGEDAGSRSFNRGRDVPEDLPDTVVKCPACGCLIEKADSSAIPGIHGCDNMTCRCGCKFCYRCGAVFSKPGTEFNPRACNCTPGHGFFDGEDVRNNYRGLFDGDLNALFGNLGDMFRNNGNAFGGGGVHGTFVAGAFPFIGNPFAPQNATFAATFGPDGWRPVQPGAVGAEGGDPATTPRQHTGNQAAEGIPGADTGNQNASNGGAGSPRAPGNQPGNPDLAGPADVFGNFLRTAMGGLGQAQGNPPNPRAQTPPPPRRPGNKL
eukprot:TRINITY_DN38483_c0_g1_i1.p1 TRINITY_DN38483_c0_g1~~TRINITY_DN38483_c0_g1_i1.p1  ORF type:complete len:572 (+),score=73.12 TRINITY_DN38483_c0_g1_i1:154-1869(+)